MSLQGADATPQAAAPSDSDFEQLEQERASALNLLAELEQRILELETEYLNQLDTQNYGNVIVGALGCPAAAQWLPNPQALTLGPLPGYSSVPVTTTSDPSQCKFSLSSMTAPRHITTPSHHRHIHITKQP